MSSNRRSARFATDVATVMAMRLTALPFWWMTDPSRASRETKKMFGEKEDAFVAMQQELMMAPARFWLDAWQGMLSGDRDGGLAHAGRTLERRVSAPYRNRVSGNRRRLSGRG